MQLTIAFITGRAAPHLDWLLTSLAKQCLVGDEIEVLAIDRQGRTPETLGSNKAGPGVHVRVELPKPNPWQGTHRLTTSDWWAKSSAINTALVLCNTGYIAFVDDCCRLGPRWLIAARRGEQEQKSVIAGTYDKIENGECSQDHRRVLCPNGKENCGGGWLYGCTFALPLAWALEVNGAEEGCDSMGSEDCIFGLMLENNGRTIDFVPDLHVRQERPEVQPTEGPSIPIRRTDKGTSPRDKSHAALERFGKQKRTEFSPPLAALRAARLSTGKATWPLPDPDLRDWYDGQLVREF